MTKQPLPFDSVALKKALNDANEIIAWKVMNKLDEMEKNRKLVAEKNRALRAVMEK